MSGSSSFRIQLLENDENEIEREAQRKRVRESEKSTPKQQLIPVANVFLVVLSTISDAVSSVRHFFFLLYRFSSAILNYTLPDLFIIISHRLHSQNEFQRK